MSSLLLLIDLVLNIYSWVVISAVIASWLINFNIINVHNPIMSQVLQILHKLTEPVLGRIRRVMPDLGGLDLSPLIVILGIFFLRSLLREYFWGI